ncbi:hypothetical protein SAMN05421638_0733 [Kaistella treverensis]|uniref:Uncharacterized protein n=1 Tax=Kaistella treverensis TaxID=631455 RepID=A0A1I3KCT1_9FLAO|nr:hypothetical protein SAMN05421638_0733 [Kaistella treverensis]
MKKKAEIAAKKLLFTSHIIDFVVYICLKLLNGKNRFTEPGC